MQSEAKRNRKLMLALTTAFATTMLAGANAHAASREDGNVSKAVGKAEEQVRKDSQNLENRSLLAATYMKEGRFQSAAASFKDAIALGDTSAKTALSYALAQIGSGNGAEALATLDQNRNIIDPSDLGLAFALAGDADQGVRLLSGTIRNGDNNMKSRQNLAYAYALQGNWRAARMMAAEDLPESQLGERMSEWADTVQPNQAQARIAKLLGVPVVEDAGLPSDLALQSMPAHNWSSGDNGGRLANAEDLPAPSERYEDGGDLEEAPAFASNETAGQSGYWSSGKGAASRRPASSEPETFAEAFKPPVPTASSISQFAQNAVNYVANAGDKGAVRVHKGEEYVPSASRANNSASASSSEYSGARAKSGPASSAYDTADNAAQSAETGSPISGGDHLVQLGSFSNQENAERAWKIFTERNPELKKFERVITKANVGGKIYYRVSAGGMPETDAASICSNVKSSGEGCLPWAANDPIPGALVRDLRLARIDVSKPEEV